MPKSDTPFFFTPRPASAAASAVPPESDARKAVPRQDLWRLADASRVFFRRATQGRQDSDSFFRARDAMEAALELLPEEVWK